MAVFMVADIETFLEGKYHVARDKHREGIELLKREFGYHPAYRKGLKPSGVASIDCPLYAQVDD
ncbi:hypothetical protein Pmar_PMAR004725 [Perkinsus marinus ATCC 50983]|uniref:Uncharacterized protein n=1 Tax=Perkinsus marinus (strain ATCC 50983 / TXsc) TaxID=423536 RepID=C5KF71_PERM5|nr:hypothetical protein Pmar_PMAR004725 [Perkinsus marinus ATCC 50983]EER16873.1 hypothetical protein Pmar_PMAR004725 [Perkinsus marinus ATCC 50983]|eukprot:XP_002785077.1 hypothetical protein Pmar_PMAR004725 [Perkinsus marinus ATCC 50983]